MKIMPFEKLVLFTNLSKSEVIEVLHLNVRPRQNFIRFSNQNTTFGKRFEGTLYGDTFNVTRIINYRNSFLPEVTGKVIEKATGTEIEMVLKPVAFVIAFMIFWLGAALLAFIATLISVINSGGSISNCLIPLGMLIFGFLMLKFGFSFENEKTKKDMIEILKARVK